MDSNFALYIETFNEVITVFTLYLMMSFTDAEPDVGIRNAIYGGFFIGVIGIYLCVHLTILFADVCKQLKDACAGFFKKLCRKKPDAKNDPKRIERKRQRGSAKYGADLAPELNESERKLKS